VAAAKFAQQPRRNVDGTMRIGLAWMTTDKGIVWHNGMTGGYGAFLGFTADGQRAVVILANTAESTDDPGFATLDASAPLPKAIILPSTSLDDYVGTYKLADKFLLHVFRMNDGLFVRPTGQSAIPIFPSAPNEFFAKVAGISMSFMRDINGMVSGLVLHQNSDRAAPKVSASELPPELQEIELDAATLGEYVGKYRLGPSVVVDFALKDDHLETQITGQPAFPVFASARDRFFLKVVDARLDFERDAGGKVIAVVLHQNGRDMRAPRSATQR
jgi:serine-type D-Ala-D-Ala carboxypeptidase/endopeptidase